MLKLPDNVGDCHTLLYAMLIEHVGGSEIAAMMADHHEDRMTLDEMAGKYEMDRKAIHRRLIKARMKLRRLGLMPAEWEARLRGSRAPVESGTSHTGTESD